jgi:hypothetical protein
MPDPVIHCAMCQGSMEAGWIPDTAREGVLQTAWMPGAPEPRYFFLGVSWKADRNVPLTAFRCTKCGHVELYALPT